MAEQLFALGDIGATHSRIGVYDSQSQECLAAVLEATTPDDYEGSVQRIADVVESLNVRHGEVVAASIAVAAQVSDSGELTKSGDLTPWVGRNFGEDLAAAFDLPADLVGTLNDVVAIAISQQHVNLRDRRPVTGIATTLSSGWGGALFWEKDITKGDEPGHEYLRQGAACPCGERDHAEAFISGKGVELNHHRSMEEWLAAIPDAREQLTIDITTAFIAMLERHRATNDFAPKEIRFTGGVALGQPKIMRQVAANVTESFGAANAPVFRVTSIGEQAGIHGTFIDARRRAHRH